MKRHEESAFTVFIGATNQVSFEKWIVAPMLTAILFLPMRMDNIKNITGTSASAPFAYSALEREREKSSDRVISSLLFFCVLQVR